MKAKLLLLLFIPLMFISCGKKDSIQYMSVVNGSQYTANVYFDNSRMLSIPGYSNGVIYLSGHTNRPIYIDYELLSGTQKVFIGNWSSYTFREGYSYKMTITSTGSGEIDRFN